MAEDAHSACVQAWLKRAKGLSTEQLLRAFEQGFGVMWGRAHQTLGNVTLTAIVDRVLYVAAERYPMFASLELEDGGIRCQGLHQRAYSLDRDQVTEGVRFVMVEFLTVLGNLTAEILTPALHAALSKVAPEAATGAVEGSRAEPTAPASRDSEDTDS
jgi:hypothetical protein